MISIVIADDEKLIRAGISKIIKDAINIPLEILEARNGKEALDLCNSEHPNVLITDIRMPIMDGVQLMQEASKLPEKPALIVLSGFDDFVYAKAAIQNGALAYILKPVDKKELISAVQQAISTFRDDEQKKSEETLKTIMDQGRIDGESVIDNNKFPNGYYCLSVFGSHCKKDLEKIFEGISYYTLESKKDYECIVISREDKLILDSDISINHLVIGVSNSSDQLSALRSVKKQSFSAALQYFFTGSKGIFYYIERPGKKTERTDQLYEQLMSRLAISDTKEVLESLGRLMDFSDVEEEDKSIRLEYIYSKICADLFTRFPDYTQDGYLQLKSIMIENLWQYETLAEWKTCVTDYIVYLSALLKKNTVEYPYINEALVYIKKNYMHNINMSMVANHVSINYTWFSEKFKEQTGINFNEYLKKLRIQEACVLLQKGCYRVYEVAEKCGFADVKYFTKSFKEVTGVAPGEWTRLHSQGS